MAKKKPNKKLDKSNKKSPEKAPVQMLFKAVEGPIKIDQFGIPYILEGESKGKAAARRVRLTTEVKRRMNNGELLAEIIESHKELSSLENIEEQAKTPIKKPSTEKVQPAKEKAISLEKKQTAKGSPSETVSVKIDEFGIPYKLQDESHGKAAARRIRLINEIKRRINKGEDLLTIIESHKELRVPDNSEVKKQPITQEPKFLPGQKTVDEYGIPYKLEGESHGKAAARRIRLRDVTKRRLDGGEELSKIIESLDELVAPDILEKPEITTADIEEKETFLQKRIVAFKLYNQSYALEINSLKEVVINPLISNVPLTKDFLVGAINIRGNLFAVIDLSVNFNLKPKKGFEITDKFALRIKSEEYDAVLLAHSLPVVLNIEAYNIEKIDNHSSKKKNLYINSIARHEGETIFMLDVFDFLSKESCVESPGVATG